MRALDWQRFMQKQREQYGKVVFTATELANVSGLAMSSLKVTLQRLVEQGDMARYIDGRYGLPGAAMVEDLVPSLDPAAYITGMYALYGHQMITQAPVEILCFTNRRHNRSRVRRTELGRIVFVCITGRVYEYPPSSVVAGPEQALCDFVYICRRQGLVFFDLVTFRNLDRLDIEQLKVCLTRYPKAVAGDIFRHLLEKTTKDRRFTSGDV